MDLIVKSRPQINAWPAFVDAMIALILMIMFTIMIYFVSNTRWVRDLYVKSRQERIELAVKERFTQEIAEGSIRIATDGNLQRISFSNKLLFTEAEKELVEGAGTELLARLRDVFLTELETDRNIFQQVDIEAHADPRRLLRSSEYATNWDLSAARAAEVVKFFAGNEQQGRLQKAAGQDILLDPALFAATGYSLFRPPEEGRNLGAAYYQGVPEGRELERLYEDARRMDVLITYSTELPE